MSGSCNIPAGAEISASPARPVTPPCHPTATTPSRRTFATKHTMREALAADFSGLFSRFLSSLTKSHPASVLAQTHGRSELRAATDQAVCECSQSLVTYSSATPRPSSGGVSMDCQSAAGETLPATLFFFRHLLAFHSSLLRECGTHPQSAAAVARRRRRGREGGGFCRAPAHRGAPAKRQPREDEKAQILLKWPPTHSAPREWCPFFFRRAA